MAAARVIGGFANWQSPRTALRSLLWGCPAVLLAGCTTLIDSTYRSLATPRGVVFQSGWHALGITGLTSEAYVPGMPAAAGTGRRQLRCDGALRVTVTWNPDQLSQQDAERACRWTASALSHVASAKRRVTYEIVLSAAGGEAYVRRRSLAPLTPLRLTFAVPWFVNEATTRDNLVALVAHEAFHLHTFLEDPYAPRSEIDAYRIGLCAQIEIGSTLGPASLPGYALDNVGAAARASSSAAETVRHETLKRLQEGEISGETPSGQQLLERCGRLWKGTR